MENLFSVLRKGGNPNGSGSRIIWTQDQITYVIDNYHQFHNTKDLATKFNVSTDAIRRLLKKNGIKLLSTQELGKIKRPRNSNYFENINTPEKAYWLGFLYADGYNNEKDNLIRINLQSDDELHLQKFLDAIDAKNFEIKHQIKDNKYYISYIEICDKKISEDLAKWGCFQRKTNKISFPTFLNQNLYSHFIRGCFDGDGSLYYSTRNNHKYFGFHLLGTFHMLNRIKEILNKEKLALEKKDNELYSFNLSGNKQIYEIMSYLYKDADSSMWLDRKKDKFNILLLQQLK